MTSRILPEIWNNESLYQRFIYYINLQTFNKHNINNWCYDCKWKKCSTPMIKYYKLLSKKELRLLYDRLLYDRLLHHSIIRIIRWLNSLRTWLRLHYYYRNFYVDTEKLLRKWWPWIGWKWKYSTKFHPLMKRDIFCRGESINLTVPILISYQPFSLHV